MRPGLRGRPWGFVRATSNSVRRRSRTRAWRTSSTGHGARNRRLRERPRRFAVRHEQGHLPWRAATSQRRQIRDRGCDWGGRPTRTGATRMHETAPEAARISEGRPSRRRARISRVAFPRGKSVARRSEAARCAQEWKSARMEAAVSRAMSGGGCPPQSLPRSWIASHAGGGPARAAPCRLRPSRSALEGHAALPLTVDL